MPEFLLSGYTIFDLDISILIFLVLGATIAGFIDAMCGGGGLISVPVLLFAGFNPAQAVAANKLQGALGAITSTCYYLNKGLISWRILRGMVLGSIVGGAAGTFALNYLGNDVLEIILPILLISAACYFYFSKDVSDLKGKARLSSFVFGFTIVPIIAFYDGFFGPGAGTFYMIAMIAIVGMNVTGAVAYSRVLNLISNSVSLILFIALGKMVWVAGIAMSIGEVIGVYFGSRVVFHNGAKIVKPLVVTSCLIMAVYSLVGATV